MAASPSPSLSAPGSSSYSSNTLHVGDGTWDTGRDTFLLPNIEGLPFDAMRYNGMGNRFRSLSEYHSLITAHGTIAAITFLVIVPAAIFIASFYHRNPRLALRMHISLQVLTVILTTVIFLLGYFAVGPSRSLTNPHHGIGLTIFLLVLVQAIGGWLIKKIEKGKVRYHIPIKLMLHQWLGRGIALLAIAQIPIGLALYGSPKSLFILYTLWMVVLLVTYFVLTYRNHVRAAGGYDDASYVTRTHSDYADDRRSRHPKTTRRLEEAAGAVGLGAALAALRRRSSGRQDRHRYEDSRTDLSMQQHGHRPAPSESVVDEKFTESDYMSRQHTWRDRLLGAGAGIGALAAARKLFGRKRVRDDDYIETESQAGVYRPPLGGAHQPQMTDSQAHLAQMEGGYGGPGFNRAGGPTRPGQVPGVTLADGPANQHASDDWARVARQEAAQEAAMHRTDLHSPAGSEHSYSTYQSQRRPFFSRMAAIPASIAAGGGLMERWKRRRARKEQHDAKVQREAEIQQERIFRATHAPYTDDSPQRPAGPGRGRVGSNSPLTVRTGSPSRSRRPSNNTAAGSNLHPPPVPQGTSSHFGSSSQVQQQPSSIPPPPRSTRAGPPPPAHSNTSSPFSSPRHQRVYDPTTPPPPRGKTVNSSDSPISPPLAATEASHSLLSPPPRAAASRAQSASPHAGVESPPVSVKVKMHNDGRHVTLRRLNEEEAARERAARAQQQGQATPGSDFSPPPPQRGRFQRQQTGLPPKNAGLSPSPAAGLGSSPSGAGYETGTGTDITDFDSNRRRRRAERARMEQQKLERAEDPGVGSSVGAAYAGAGRHVEFT